jgi:cytochrome c biogenesis protein CcmG/thiol:disulfide interchange protein DsbE
MTERSEFAAKIMLLGFVALFVVFFSRPHGGNRAPKLGEAVPGFSLPQDEGKAVNLADYRGKILVLNFWATWCPPCIDEMPSLNRLAERYSAKGLQVVAVSLDEDPDAYRAFLAKNKIAFLTVRNPSRVVSEEYGTFKLPESYIISRDGRLLNKIIGAADWTNQEMISYFEGLLAGS